MGTGLAFLNNLGQLVIALGGESNGQAVFVSLFSVSSCAGRLLLGCVLPCRTFALTHMLQPGTAHGIIVSLPIVTSQPCSP